ncbi:MAG: HIT family protein [Paludibacteraceae bacterium]|nr:HIT family protein [Bacteroidales bacterium]MBP3466374.1 HIT family protein [Paludibacteraceae bacterium]MBQ2591406.1 HIT family protein [Paludibacteraceae bacterium]MBQ3681244.1 HIT family protein [Paludibacteraceae bacterium]MBQ3895529.1 HIT family protein [Paludibacteraceae bacterium]
MASPKSECLYCQHLPVLDELMIKIADLEVSQLFLFKEQSHPGRCNVVYKDHGVEFHELSEEQRNAFMRDVAKVGNAIQKAFNPDKINYGAFADTLSHLHMHIVPKYKGGYNFGGVIEMNPKKTYLTDEQYNETISKIKANL